MSYTAVTDFIALLRQTGQGVRTVRMPGMDYVVAAMARAGLFELYVGQTAPTIDQSITVWFKPALASWVSEGAVYLYDVGTAQYELATPTLWGQLFASTTPSVVQNITAPGPAAVAATATIVRVNQSISAPIVLTMPLAALKTNGVLISDWKGDAGTNNITVNLAGSDKFPGALTSWTIGNDGGSIYLRPVAGGYVL